MDDIAPAPPADDFGGWIAMAVMIALTVVAVLLFHHRRWHRLPREPLRPQAFPPGVGFALYIAQYLAAMIGATLAAQWFATNIDRASYTFEQQTLVSAGAYALQAVVIGVYAWLVFTTVRTTNCHSNNSDQRSCRWRAFLYGAGALLLFWPIAQTASRLAAFVEQRIKGAPPPMVGHETLQQMIERPMDGWFFARAAIVLIVAPIAEEVLYRGVFQETMRRLNVPPWLAIFATSALFALMHYSVAQPNAIASLFVLSLGFGWIYEKTGRLTASIVMHMLFNAGNLVAAMLLAQH